MTNIVKFEDVGHFTLMGRQWMRSRSQKNKARVKVLCPALYLLADISCLVLYL